MTKITNNHVATQTDVKELREELRTEIKRTEKSLRAEFKRSEKAVRTEILRLEGRVENLDDSLKEVKQEVHTTHGKLDKLQNTLDGFVGRVDHLTTDNEVGAHHTRELELKAKNHEERIIQLESPAR